MFFEACNIMNNKLVFLIRYVGNVERPFSFLSVILLLLFFLQVPRLKESRLTFRGIKDLTSHL